jgi:probable F420-dependent oxidoreductase
MRAFLDAMDDDPFVSPDGTRARRPPVRRVIAALREPMLRLAAERADGAHTFLVPSEHTDRARVALGPERMLIVEHKVLLEPDAATARERGRRALSWYLDTPNYVESLRSLGFRDDDLAGGGSDRLVDALVAWGDETQVVERLREHLDAGADQVAVQPLGRDGDPLGLDVLRRLAPALRELG